MIPYFPLGGHILHRIFYGNLSITIQIIINYKPTNSGDDCGDCKTCPAEGLLERDLFSGVQDRFFGLVHFRVDLSFRFGSFVSGLRGFQFGFHAFQDTLPENFLRFVLGSLKSSFCLLDGRLTFLHITFQCFQLCHLNSSLMFSVSWGFNTSDYNNPLFH